MKKKKKKAVKILNDSTQEIAKLRKPVVFISEGTLAKHALPTGQVAIQDNRTFEGWRHEN